MYLLIVGVVPSLLAFFFFKQETAYELRISDWSSDVCSSDLFHAARDGLGPGLALLAACDHLLGALDVDACLQIVKRCTQQLPERRGFAIVVDRRVVRGIASPLVLNQARELEASKVGRYPALRQIPTGRASRRDRGC